ncbi:hypothetical protein KFK09_014025 [Dendrobium nobile]|uniref:Uncharacterized protein n=1 Tax=Dendrobium nobile TaxID=94219 RepID=A0A8T3B914_DENNO|nr:hypothetical protein KFK09_014025 [Dendrobium nobile]
MDDNGTLGIQNWGGYYRAPPLKGNLGLQLMPSVGERDTKPFFSGLGCGDTGTATSSANVKYSRVRLPCRWALQGKFGIILTGIAAKCLMFSMETIKNNLTVMGHFYLNPLRVLCLEQPCIPCRCCSR